MSRLPATSAENLANELHRQLELVEFERDEAIRERDEAQAVIDRVRGVRGLLWQEVDRLGRSRRPADQIVVARLDATRTAVSLLDEVDGL